MGFNKTADGRVFFSTSNDDDNEPQTSASRDEEPSMPSGALKSPPKMKAERTPLTGKPMAKRPEMLSEADQTQAQILGVLKSVNERLVATKKERDQMRRDLNNYKDIVKDLHAKSVKSEKSAQALENAERRFELMNDKVVNALAKSAQIERKVEKITQERERMMRKMDRIENQVVRTHELLSAQRPAALLADLERSSKALAADTVITPSPRFALDDDEMIVPWWRRSKAFGIIALLCLFVAGIIGGWALNQQQNANIASLSLAPQEIIEPTQNTLNDFVPESRILIDPREINFGETVTEEENFFAAPEGVQDAINTDALNEQMATDPQGVAETLNALEPSSAPQTPKELPRVNEGAVKKTVAPQSQPASLTPSDKATPARIVGPQTNINISPDSTLPTAMKRVEAQAFAGNAAAQHDLAAIYTAGQGGVTQSYDRAAAWFAVAANNGVANAAYNLGVLNQQGIGRAPNLPEAMKWYRKAARASHPEAQYNLGIAYVEGVGVPYDAERAADYFRDAAAQGMMEAAYNLGLIYENGLVGDAKPQQALAWYKTAADKGSPQAKAALEKLANSLNVPMAKINKIKQNSTNAVAPPATPELISAVQKELTRTGFFPGAVSGRMDQLSRDAVRSYQARNGLAVTGVASLDLLTHLRTQPSAGQSRLNQ